MFEPGRLRGSGGNLRLSGHAISVEGILQANPRHLGHFIYSLSLTNYLSRLTVIFTGYFMSKQLMFGCTFTLKYSEMLEIRLFLAFQLFLLNLSTNEGLILATIARLFCK